MTRTDFEKLGDLHKGYENFLNSATLMPQLPVVVRLDGRAFHTFTKGMRRPYDSRMMDAMAATTRYLVAEFNANIGYTQSDEITLIFDYPKTGEFLFNGRVGKLCTVLAAATSVKFYSVAAKTMPERTDKILPTFDARVMQYPTQELAVDCLRWREADATRNSLTAAAHSQYSTRELHKAGYAQKHEMLFKKGINWANYPVHFKRGVYFQRATIVNELSPEEIAAIPPNHAPPPGTRFHRRKVVRLDMPPVSKVLNLCDVVFKEVAPLTISTDSDEVPSDV